MLDIMYTIFRLLHSSIINRANDSEIEDTILTDI